MAFDSNPQAVYHGAGFAELEPIGTPTFNLNSDTKYSNSSTATSFNIEERTENDNQLLYIGFSGGDAGTGSDGALHAIRAGDIPKAAVTTGGSGVNASNTNGLSINVRDNQGTVGHASIHLARNASGNMVANSSDESKFGGSGFVVTIYKVK